MNKWEKSTPKKHMAIEWDKVVTQAVSTIVTAAFVGACVIVWRGATTVDAKVQKNRDDIDRIIDQLSDKLATYQVHMLAISNQIDRVIKFQAISTPMMSAPRLPMIENDVQQKAYRQDIYQQLKK